MVKGILGKKVGMTQIFDAEGRVVPVTVVTVDPNVVSQVRTVDNDGYSAAQIGFEDIHERRLTRPEQGHLPARAFAPSVLARGRIQDGETVTSERRSRPTFRSRREGPGRRALPRVRVSPVS